MIYATRSVPRVALCVEVLVTMRTGFHVVTTGDKEEAFVNGSKNIGFVIDYDDGNSLDHEGAVICGADRPFLAAAKRLGRELSPAIPLAQWFARRELAKNSPVSRVCGHVYLAIRLTIAQLLPRTACGSRGTQASSRVPFPVCE